MPSNSIQAKADPSGPVTLEDWEIKTLVQDVEQSGVDVDDVTLEILEQSANNPDYYGTQRNAKYKSRRQAISHKLQDFKRRTPQSWLKFVKGNQVKPSKFTVENAISAEQQSKKDMDYVDSTFNNLGIDDSDSFGFETQAPTPLPSVTTPPRSKSNSYGVRGFGAAKSPDRPLTTPPKSIHSIASITATTFSSSSAPAIVYGSYEYPWKCDIVPGHSGRYINNLWIYEEPKQVKPGDKKYCYQGYLFTKKVDAPDIALYSAFVADGDYKEMLHHNGIIAAADKDCGLVVVRAPYIEAFDRVGKNGLIPHQWISQESQETVQIAHTNIKVANETDESPGPSWCYTVAKLPEGYTLDNRVFSDHNYNISPFESMPEKVKIAALGNEEVLSFHMMWRVALANTEMLMDETEKMSLAERIKKKREAHKHRL